MSRLFEAMERAATKQVVETAVPGPVPVDAPTGIDAFRSEGGPSAKVARSLDSRETHTAPVVPDAGSRVASRHTVVRERVVQDPAAHAEATALTARLHDAEWRNAFDEYRRMAATLIELRTEREIHSIVVTSAVPGEGKSLTATNLALTLANAYRKSVLLVDADLRRPSLHQAFAVRQSPGLAECVVDGRTRQGLPLHLGRLDVMPAGTPDGDPSGVLSSQKMRELVEAWSKRYDWIVLDTPPAVLMPDAGLLATFTDAVVLVVQAGKTPHAAVQQAVDSVGSDRIAGVVLNQMAPETAAARQYGHYGSYYGHKDQG